MQFDGINKYNKSNAWTLLGKFIHFIYAFYSSNFFATLNALYIFRLNVIFNPWHLVLIFLSYYYAFYIAQNIVGWNGILQFTNCIKSLTMGLKNKTSSTEICLLRANNWKGRANLRKSEKMNRSGREKIYSLCRSQLRSDTREFGRILEV